jgi:alkylation response protein AidB-like acyl-CoA dehydrogenase
VEFDFTEEDQRFRRELIELLDASLPPDWERITKDGPGSDAQAAFSRGFCAKLAERGWLTPHWPIEHGGGGGTAWRHAILSEEMWKRGEPRGPQYMNVNWIGPAIIKFGTDQQKKQHLPKMARGDSLWCQGFSEPNAGSDLASLKTRAVKEGEQYVVNGQKIWTSYCKNAEFCFLLARTHAEEKRHRGLSVLLMPMDLPGIGIREIDAVIGERYFHEVFLTDVRVPVAARLGPEHEGWAVANYALQYERVGAPRWARAEWTLDRLAEDARSLGRLADGTVLEKLAEARSLSEAARVLHYRVTDQRAHELPPSADSNVARIAGTMADRAVGDLALEIWGPEALVHGSPGDANFRAAMSAGIATGTTEINLNLIAERLLGLPRERR